MVALHKNGPSSVATMAKLIGVHQEAASSALNRLHKKAHIEVVSRRTVGLGRNANNFDLNDKLRALSLEALTEIVSQQKTAPPMPPKKPRPVNYRVEALSKDAERVQFMAINAPYLSRQEIADALGEPLYTVIEAAQILGIDFCDDLKDPRARDIAATLSFIPPGTQISQWTGGTCFHLPSDLPGITRVTRHYAAE